MAINSKDFNLISERFAHINKKTIQTIYVWGNYYLKKEEFINSISSKKSSNYAFSLDAKELREYKYFNDRESTIYQIITKGMNDELEVILEFKNNLVELQPIGNLKLSIDVLEKVHRQFIAINQNIANRLALEEEFVRSDGNNWDAFVSAYELMLKEIEEYQLIFKQIDKKTRDIITATSEKLISVSLSMTVAPVPFTLVGGIFGGAAGFFSAIGSKILIGSSLPVKDASLIIAALGASIGYIYTLVTCFLDMPKTWNSIDIRTSYKILSRIRKNLK